jgi:hypothetical protein
MIIPHITKSQKHLLFLLYKFRFLTTNHFQKLLNHKNPKRIQIWLKDLKDKKFISTNDSPKSFIDNTKPFTYYLAARARHILKDNENCDVSVLDKIYKEKNRTEKFVKQCLTIADIYLFFISQKEKEEELHFFTKNELEQFDYFPHDLPSAYLAVKTNDSTKRYFLDVFDEYTPPFVFQNRVVTYLKYVDNGEWEAHTNGDPLPAILFICPTDRRKKHVNYYTKALFEKAFEEKIDLFLTTKDKIIFGKSKNVWEKVTL